MSEDKFLVDTNVFIRAYLDFYAFDLVPAFWDELSRAGEGRIVVLDKVKAEVDAGKNALSSWLNAQDKFIRCSHVDQDIADMHEKVMDFLKNGGMYKPDAVRLWDGNSVADPWIIATAAVRGYVVITFETPNGPLTSKQPRKTPKIPDVALKFGVETQNLYHMMKQLGMKIKGDGPISNQC